jgi:gas vesicle protein
MMKRTWRFFLGAAIGLSIGYAATLLLQTPAKPRLRTIYKAPVEEREEQPAA